MIPHYRQFGWATIRVRPMGKAPIGAWQGRTDEPGDFALGENVGVRLGEPSGGLVDIDLDCPEGVSLAPLFLPPTATFGRASKLRSHWLYTCPGQRTRKPPRTGIELRSTGGQTVFPPSIHECGEPITWTDETPVATLDEAALLTAFGRLAAATVLARCWPRLEGNKHDTVLAVAGALWHEGWTLDDVLAMLLPAMELDGSVEPHREAAIRDTWEDHDRPRYGWPTVAELLGPLDAKAFQRAVELVPSKARPTDGGSTEGMRPLTDLGNAERLLDEHGEDLRYVPCLDWLQWDQTRWGSTGEPVPHVAGSVRKLQKIGADSGQPSISKWGHSSESAARVRAAISLAKDLPQLQTTADALDADPWLLCTPNGVVDLRTGQLREHQREDLITKMAGTEYDAKAQAPRFVQFLGEVFCGDWALAQYVLRYLGYSLTGSVREQVFQVWHGHGANAKSTFLDTIRYVLGDYSQSLASDLLMERRQGRASEAASPDVARLRGVRFAAGVETKAGQRWNESLVKQLTGGDRVVARQLYRSAIEFDATWKIVLAVNHKPIVRGTDRGMWRRIHLVPFEASFEGAKADRTLPGKLRDEAPGILALLVRACLEWQREGLEPPERVRAEVESYRASQDVVGQFLEECCVVDRPATALRTKMYQAYRHWCSQGGEFQLGKHQFNNELRERGLKDRKSGGWTWQGLGLRTDQSFGVAV